MLIVFSHLYCWLGGEPTGEPTHDDLMVDKAGTKTSSYYSSSSARRCNTWQWLVVGFSAKQKHQLHHQQLTNVSTILQTFTFPVNLDLFNLSTVSFGSILIAIANILSNLHTPSCLAYVFHSHYLPLDFCQLSVFLSHSLKYERAIFLSYPV